MASANEAIKAQKAAIVAEISEQIKGADSIVVVDYRGLTVAEDTKLRKALREEGVVYKVYKNTFITSAIKGTDFEGIAPYLEGPTAIAIGKEDATAPARVIAKFAKDAKALEIKGGVVEGNVYDVKGIEKIATIPSRDQLISKLLGSLQSPITNFARVMNQLAEKGGAQACAAPAQEAAPAVEEAPAPAAEEAPAEAPAEA
ncbi:MAG: 50S ribosomal protein L10 [Lachnospiraceae bacterium]|nr:50S ribosomal protein L10 [Lachnospiraceae bacterium]MBR5994819.1 50S ribosomal protein L10 [Lachnospiraceae bacterium]